jgi:integrase
MSKKTRTVSSGAACTGGPLRTRCTTAKDGRSRSVHPHQGLLRAARAWPESRRAGRRTTDDHLPARLDQSAADGVDPAQQSSPLAQRPYDLRHACMSTWLNGGVYPTQVAEWAGHSVDVLLRIYAKCIVGQDELAKRRISEALLQD